MRLDPQPHPATNDQTATRRDPGRLPILHVIALVAASLLAGPLVGVAGAQPPESTERAVNATRHLVGLSAACGFRVDIHFEGTITVRLFLNNSGLVVREQDRSNVTGSFSASTGKSFSYRVASERYDYEGGARIGSAAVLTISGADFKVPGNREQAGQLRFSGTVVGFDGDIPLVELDDLIKSTPTTPTPTEAICEALR